jgi:hypothetical protein
MSPAKGLESPSFEVTPEEAKRLLAESKREWKEQKTGVSRKCKTENDVWRYRITELRAKKEAQWKHERGEV